MPRSQVDLKVVLLKTKDHWTAQCLNHDVGAEATDPEVALDKLERVLIARIVLAEMNGRDLMDGIPSTPAVYNALCDKAELYTRKHQTNAVSDGLCLSEIWMVKEEVSASAIAS